MKRPTLASFRAAWPAEALGVCQADPKVIAYCNEAQERLLIDPLTPETGWYGTWARMNFSVSVTNTTAYVTTPREVARLTDLAVCQRPVHIRNGFYEFMAYGRGLEPKNCQGIGCGSQLQAFDRDSVFTLADLLATPQIIRMYPTDARDAGLRVLLQGKDQNSQAILTTDPNTGLSAPGEYCSLAFPFADSVNQYSSLSGVQKDETYGPVQYVQVDPVTGAELPLSSMEPNESTALYRRYLVNGIPSQNLCCVTPGNPVTLTAMARLDFIPVANETDYLSLPNIPAVLEECQSLRYSRMDGGGQNAQLHHARAIALLNGALDLYEGKINVAVSVPLFGSARFHRQPV